MLTDDQGQQLQVCSSINWHLGSPLDPALLAYGSTRDWSPMDQILRRPTQLMSTCLSGGHDRGWWPGAQGHPQRGMLWLWGGPMGSDCWAPLQEMQSGWVAPSLILQAAFPWVISDWCWSHALFLVSLNICALQTLSLPLLHLAVPSGVSS